LDVAFNMPADQLKEYMIVCFKTEVMVDSDKAKTIELTRNHSYNDDDAQ